MPRTDFGTASSPAPLLAAFASWDGPFLEASAAAAAISSPPGEEAESRFPFPGNAVDDLLSEDMMAPPKNSLRVGGAFGPAPDPTTTNTEFAAVVDDAVDEGESGEVGELGCILVLFGVEGVEGGAPFSERREDEDEDEDSPVLTSAPLELGIALVPLSSPPLVPPPARGEEPLMGVILPVTPHQQRRTPGQGTRTPKNRSSSFSFQRTARWLSIEATKAEGSSQLQVRSR